LHKNVFKDRQQEWILKIGRPMPKPTRNMADTSQTAHPQEKTPLSKYQINSTHGKTLNEKKCGWKMSIVG